MTPAGSLYRELRALGVVLSIDERGRLAFDAPEGVLAGDALERLRAHRQELLGIVERFEERAAIIEFDGGLPRPEAERLAMEEVIDGAPEPMAEGVCCPYCRRRRLVDVPEGCRCWDCGRLAWVIVAGSIIRADWVGIDLEIWPELSDRSSSR